MRTVHRILSLFVIVFALYLGVAGTLIQLTDLRTLYTHAPADDPNMMAIREGINGTSDFQVMDLFADLSLIFLTVSGGGMYFQLWQRRRSSGRVNLLWK